MANSRLANTGDTAVDTPRVFALASGKGGVGKSILTFNLAAALADRGARVLLVDADFHMGNQHILANVTPDRGWSDYCAGQCSLAEAAVAITDNLSLLASYSRQAEELLPDLKKMAGTLANLRQEAGEFDIILFDTASGILPHSTLVLNTVDTVILVTTPELTAISDTYALYKILSAHNHRISASLLINRENREDEIDYITGKFAAIAKQFLGHCPSFLGHVMDDSLVVDSVARQLSILEMAPESDLSERFRALAEALFAPVSGSRITSEDINLTPAGADIRE
jgi:flagellar biosynthesis protein FlhG